jgi:hypothetical protein
MILMILSRLLIINRNVLKFLRRFFFFLLYIFAYIYFLFKHLEPEDNRIKDSMLFLYKFESTLEEKKKGV